MQKTHRIHTTIFQKNLLVYVDTFMHRSNKKKIQEIKSAVNAKIKKQNDKKIAADKKQIISDLKLIVLKDSKT
jgi:hypothetical protein